MKAHSLVGGTKLIKDAFLTTLISDMISFRNYVNELLTKIYTSEYIYELLENDLLYITNSLLERIQEASGVISPEVSLIENIWSQNSIQKIAYSINNAEVKNYPFEIINVYKDLIVEIEDSNVEIATVPENMFNNNQISFSFQPLWKMLDYVYFRLSKIGIERPEKIHRLIKLTYPKEFKNDIFIAGIYAHEIGHYFERSKDLREEIFLKAKVHDQFKSNLMVHLRKVDNTGKLIDINDVDYINATRYLIDSWIGEIFSDLMGVYILGPAFVFANMEYDLHSNALRSNYLGDGKITEPFGLSHPPRSLRAKIQLEILSELIGAEDFSSEIKSELDKVDNYFKSYELVFNNGPILINDRQRYVFLLSEQSISVIKDYLRGYLPHIKTQVKDLVKDNGISREKWRSAVILADQRIGKLLPPNEHGEINANSISIINSSWIARVQHFDDISGKIGTEGLTKIFDTFGVINDLTLFGLNSSRVKTRWSDYGAD